MTAVSWFVDLARNNAWANHCLYAACERLSANELTATRTSFFPAIDRTLWHIALVDRFYLGALLGDGTGVEVFDDHDTPPAFAAIRDAQREADRTMIRFVRGLDDAGLSRIVVVNRGADGRFDERVGDVLLHTFQHSIHHRGQVHAMLSGTPVKPPQLDEYFLAQDRARADEELALVEE